MKPLFLAVVLVVARDHGAPADVAAEAVAGLEGVGFQLWFFFLQGRGHACCGGGLGFRAGSFLFGRGFALGDADFGAFGVAVGDDAGGGAFTSAGGRFGVAGLLFVGEGHAAVAAAAEAGAAVGWFFAHGFAGFEDEAGALGDRGRGGAAGGG